MIGTPRTTSLKPSDTADPFAVTTALVLLVAATTGTFALSIGRHTLKRTHPVRAVALTIANTVTVAAVLIIGIVVYGTVTGTFRLVPVLTGSMNPAISEGDAAWTEPVTVNHLTPGDVIVFNAPADAPGPLANRTVIHRIHTVVPATEINDPDPHTVYFETKGDANQHADPWILALNETSTVERSTDRIRHGGTVIDVFHGRTGTAVVLLLAATGLIRTGLRHIAANNPSGRLSEPHTGTNI